MLENNERFGLEGNDQPKPAHLAASQSPERSEMACEQQDRYQRLAEQIRRWATEDPEYDEQVGEILGMFEAAGRRTGVIA